MQAELEERSAALDSCLHELAEIRAAKPSHPWLDPSGAPSPVLPDGKLAMSDFGPSERRGSSASADARGSERANLMRELSDSRRSAADARLHSLVNEVDALKSQLQVRSKI